MKEGGAGVVILSMGGFALVECWSCVLLVSLEICSIHWKLFGCTVKMNAQLYGSELFILVECWSCTLLVSLEISSIHW